MLVTAVPMSCVILGLHDMFGNTLKIQSVALVFFLIVVFIPGAAAAAVFGGSGRERCTTTYYMHSNTCYVEKLGTPDPFDP